MLGVRSIASTFGCLAALAVAACATFDERVAEYQRPERWITSLELGAKLPKVDPDDQFAFLEKYPLGTSYLRRRCGTRVGNTLCAIDAETGEFGSDEPLASTAPLITDFLLTGLYGPGRTVERQFRMAHIRHDLCFVHGRSTFGLSRPDCDADMAADLERICDAIYKREERIWCESRRALILAAVSTVGPFFYRDNPQPICEYDAKLGPARDFILTGNFEGTGHDVAVVMPANGGRSIRIDHRRVDPNGKNGATALVDSSTIELEDIVLLFPHYLQRDTIAPQSPGKLFEFAAAQDLLVYTPQVADIDEHDGDEIVLVGRQRVDGKEKYYGEFFLPLRRESGKWTASRAFLARALDEERGRQELDAHRRMALDEAFQHRILIGEIDDVKGNDLALASIATLDKPEAEASNGRVEDEAVEIRLFAFSRQSADFEMRAAGTRYSVFAILDPFQEYCGYLIGNDIEKHKTETQKRLQYDPVLLDRQVGKDAKLMFLWRSKCEHRLSWSFLRQSTLLSDTVLLPSDWTKLDDRSGPRSFVQMRLMADGRSAQQLDPARLEGGMLEGWGREAHPSMWLRSGTNRLDMFGLAVCNFEDDDEDHSCFTEKQRSLVYPGGHRPSNLVLTKFPDPVAAHENGKPHRSTARIRFDDELDCDKRPCQGRREWEQRDLEQYVIRPAEPDEPEGDENNDVTIDLKGKPTLVHYSALTSAYLQRASLVARLGENGEDGILMIWPRKNFAKPTENEWAVLTIVPKDLDNPDPEARPVREFLCTPPKHFSSEQVVGEEMSPFSLLRSALVTARAPGMPRDSILAVRRDLSGNVAQLRFGGIAPDDDGDGYKTIGGDACRDSPFKWKVETLQAKSLPQNAALPQGS